MRRLVEMIDKPHRRLANLSLPDREAAMRRLRREAANKFGDARLVFGEGALDSKIMIVGEAPGREEEVAGRPFVGQAGRMLDELMLGAGIRRADVFVTNLVKIKPIRQRGGRSGIRAPYKHEVSGYLPLLREEIEIVCPRVVVCLGGLAASSLIHPKFSISVERGRWFEGSCGPAYIATFHPAYVCRFGLPPLNRLIEIVRRDLAAAACRAR